MCSICGGGRDSSNSKKIEKQLLLDNEKQKGEFKLLLLGPGESGKSTFAKQLRHIHHGISLEERESYRSIIYLNTISAMKTLVGGASKLNIEIGDKESAEVINAAVATDKFPKDIVTAIKKLWKDEGIRQIHSRQNELQLIDSAEYYFNEVDRIGAEDYSPTVDDVLRSRMKTTGIIEIEFKVDGYVFKVMDVGGQRNERKKWIHCFEEVTAVMFCVAMSEYDLRLHEDDRTPRMEESLSLFGDICNSKWFRETPIMLFLNKKDIFAEKITKIPLEKYFDAYTGGPNYDAGLEFIKDMFLLQNENPDRPIYVKDTCGLDTDNVKTVFDNVKDIVVGGKIKANPL